MTEQDKMIQELRREIEALKTENAFNKDFINWLRTEGFGEEQFRQITAAYYSSQKVS